MLQVLEVGGGVVRSALPLQGADVALQGCLQDFRALLLPYAAQNALHALIQFVFVLLLAVQLDTLLDGELDLLGFGLFDCEVRRVDIDF